MSFEEHKEKITTIIPTFRRPDMLRRAIESALAQDIKGLIVSVFDNHSGDRTKEIVNLIKGSSSSVQYHEHATNIGGAANFEYGLRSVRTPYFSLLSDDDYLLPGFYNHALRGFEEHPEIMFWAGTTINVDEQNTIWDARIDRWPFEGLFSPPHGIKNILNGMSPIWTGIVFRREVLDEIGLPDKETLGPSDLDFILKIAAKYPYMVKKHPSAVFTLNTASFSNTQPLSSFWPGWKKMFINVEEAISDYDDRTKLEIMQTLNKDAIRMLFRRGANAIAQGRSDFAKDAADALRNDCGKFGAAFLLSLLANSCSVIPWLQQAYTKAYLLAEKRIIDKREYIQNKYQHLIKPL